MLFLMLFLDNSLSFFNFLGLGFYNSEKGIVSNLYLHTVWTAMRKPGIGVSAFLGRKDYILQWPTVGWYTGGQINLRPSSEKKSEQATAKRSQPGLQWGRDSGCEPVSCPAVPGPMVKLHTSVTEQGLRCSPVSALPHREPVHTAESSCWECTWRDEGHSGTRVLLPA